MQWAAHMVNEAKDRSKTLIQRVMHLSDANDSFAVITKGLETWTEISKDVTHYNANVLQGLDVPRWRETKDLKHETILESVNLASLVNPGEPLPGGRTDIRTKTEARTQVTDQLNEGHSVCSGGLLVRGHGFGRSECRMVRILDTTHVWYRISGCMGSVR